MKEGGGRNSEAESDKAKKIEKILYKNQKRRTRNRLIYIVGLHVLMIFSFVAFLCAQYLVSHEWFNYLYISIISDFLYCCYSLETLFSIKFKNRKLLITSIITLALAFGTKLTVFISLLQHSELDVLILGHLVFLVLNCMVPWILLLLWNKLKQNKWRQTFDMQTKLTSHLLKEEIN